MPSRRTLLQAGAASLVAAIRPLPARAAEMPGVTDSEIKIGQTIAYSGPASAYGAIGRAETAYFRMINEMGGINGRKINFVSLDDGYSPPRTVEQTRRLVEQDKVAFIFASLGTPTNTAIRAYLNDNKIPQLFIYTGASKWADPTHFPWTMGFIPNYQTEAHIYVEHILTSNPKAKIGILFQNDDFGRDYLIGAKARLGSEHAGMLVKEVSFEVTDPTVDSQVVSLQSSGADTFVIAATPKFAAQAIRKSYDLGWKAARYLTNVSISVGAVMKPAGLQKGVGIISAAYLKDSTDPRWKDDAGYKKWVAFMQKYMPGADVSDIGYIAGYNGAEAMVQVLRQCGKDLSRGNIMRQAQGLKDLELAMLLPGITLNTGLDNLAPIKQMQLARFNGQTWRVFGDVMNG